MTDSQRSLTLFIILSLAVCLVGAAQYVQSSRIRTLETKLQQMQGVGRQPSDSTALPTAPISLTGAASKGNPGAQVAILVYTDFQCPFCGVFAKTILPEIERRYVDTSRVFLAVKHLPLESLHPFAFRAAEAAACAGDQGQFWPMHDLLFSTPRGLDHMALNEHAKALRLDEPRYSKCMAGQFAARIRQDVAEAQKLSISGTPTFFVGRVNSPNALTVSTRLSGVQSVDRLSSVLDELLRDPEKKD